MPIVMMIELLSLPALAIWTYRQGGPAIRYALLACLVLLGLHLSVPLSAHTPVAVIHKSSRTLSWTNSSKVHTVGLGPTSGAKTANGDGKTPEGCYYVCSREVTADDCWMGLSYPNLRDAQRGRLHAQISWLELVIIASQNRLGQIPWQSTLLGGAIGIHNGGAVTAGCIGLPLEQLHQIYPELPVGAGVTIQID